MIDLLLFVLLLAAVTALKALVLIKGLKIDARKPPLADPRVFAVEYLMVVTLLPAMTWLLARRGQSWRDLGLEWPQGAGFLAGALGVVVVALILNRGLRAVFGRRYGRPPASPYEAIRGQWRPYLVMLPYALLFVGLVEELSFRGFLLSRVAFLLGGGESGWYAAAVGVALLFGLAHLGGGPPAAVNGALLGLLFGLAYVATGSLTLVVAAHSFYDAIKITTYFLARD